MIRDLFYDLFDDFFFNISIQCFIYLYYLI